MKKFDYIIVTSDNQWESTGNQSTEEQLQQDIKDVKKRLRSEGREDEAVYVYKSESMEVKTV